ncbi:hypothetical protein Y1Q_0014016 [Alligator mississippiensis]|uniref:Uncharacterized protein n=1 Tax=Alligator mississippiensis TaxID=8496 RepID=A0A151PDC5_ALLMI|nr:hypothetical protein Y1Q_0014016 [Alligator mississippiensis]
MGENHQLLVEMEPQGYHHCQSAPSSCTASTSTSPGLDTAAALDSYSDGEAACGLLDLSSTLGTPGWAKEEGKEWSRMFSGDPRQQNISDREKLLVPWNGKGT